MNFKEVQAKSVLHYHDTKFASNYDLNIYRGCEHKCEYCFAQYSHKYLESDFFSDIYIKTNVAEILDKELAKNPMNHTQICICGVCDCYQPAEEKYKLMPDILRVLIKHKQSAFILTKSPLILRDYDLIAELAFKTKSCIATSITTLNEEIRQKLEPHTFSSMDRLNALKEIAKIPNCATTVMLMPIIPYLTDNIHNLESIYKISKDYKIGHIIAGALHLRGNLKKNFYEFLKNNFYETYLKIQHIYKNSYVSQEYNQKLNKFLLKMKQKYNIYSYKMPEIKVQTETKDTDLFDFL